MNPTGLSMNDLFPSKWLKSEDFAPGEVKTVTIQHVTREEFDGDKGKEQKAVAYFFGGKPIILNKTNAELICQMYGEPMHWAGKSIQLHVQMVESFGKMVPGIRVVAFPLGIQQSPVAPVAAYGGSAPAPAPAPRPVPPAAPAPVAAPSYDTFDLDEYQAGNSLGGLYEWMREEQPGHPQLAEIKQRLNIGAPAPRPTAARPSPRAASEPYGADEPSYEDFEGAGLPLQ